MNKVKVGFFSFTEITDPAQHRAYNEWHQLDHLPEQYPVARRRLSGNDGSRPRPAVPARAVDEDQLRAVHYMTLYLMTEPVRETLDEFMDLGQQLYSLGRFHLHRRARLSGPHQWLDAHAAPRVRIAAETLPYRPNRGVYVTVEELHRGVRPEEYLDWVRQWHEEEAERWNSVSGITGIVVVRHQPLSSGASQHRWKPTHHGALP